MYMYTDYELRETNMEVSGKLCEKENVTELCEPCREENLSNHATGFCKDCDEFMCQKCFGDHLKARSCRNHVLDPICGVPFQRKLRIREEKCKTHTSEFVKYYCSLHDFIGCGDCIVSTHGKCEPRFIKDLAMNLEKSSEFKSLISQLQKSDAEKVESEAHIACYRKENCMLLAKAIREIKEFRRDIDCWLDKMETNIEEEVRKFSDNNEQTFSQLQKIIVEVSDDIERINQLLDTNIHHGENLFIRMIECKSEVGVIDKTLSEIKSKIVFQVYKFEHGKDMKEMLKSLEKLGNVKVITKTGKEKCKKQSTENVNMPPLAEGSCIANESKPEDVWTGETSNVNEFWYPLRAELEEELENIRQKAILEKEEKESLQQAYNILKKELEAQEAMLTRERENSVVMAQERDQTTFVLKQEISSLKELNTSLNSQLDSRNKEYGLLETKHDQNNSTIHSLQSELKKTREDYESLSRQILDLQLQRDSANKNIVDLQQQSKSAMRELSDLKVQLKQKDEMIIRLQQEIHSIKTQLDSRIKEHEILVSTCKARQEQDQNTIQSLQSKLKKLSENHEEERETLSNQIRAWQRQTESAQKTYQLPDPRAAGFDVGKRVESTHPFLKGRTGTVAAVYPSGYVYVKWDDGGSSRYTAGSGGQYWVKLL